MRMTDLMNKMGNMTTETESKTARTRGTETGRPRSEVKRGRKVQKYIEIQTKIRSTVQSVTPRSGVKPRSQTTSGVQSVRPRSGLL